MALPITSLPILLTDELRPMIHLLAMTLVTVFVLLALVHVYWALGGSVGKSSAIPHIRGVAVFRPSFVSTLAIAGVLLLCAALIVGLSVVMSASGPQRWLVRFAYVLAAILLLRAVGDFQLVGFFKRERGSAFARLDTLFFSPLCLLLSVGVFFVGYSNVP
jgi:hypothetical protein